MTHRSDAGYRGMFDDVPWHPGDLATSKAGPLLVIEVDGSGPSVWYWLAERCTEEAASGDPWPADAQPDFRDVGTVARWTLGLHESVQFNRPMSLVRCEACAGSGWHGQYVGNDAARAFGVRVGTTRCPVCGGSGTVVRP